MTTPTDSLLPVAGNCSNVPVRSKELPTLASCRVSQPLSDIDSARVVTQREAIGLILRGLCKRLIVLVGPCSVHSVEQTLDYTDQPAAAKPCFEDALLNAIRVYNKKLRIAAGRQGLVLDPALHNSGC